MNPGPRPHEADHPKEPARRCPASGTDALHCGGCRETRPQQWPDLNWGGVTRIRGLSVETEALRHLAEPGCPCCRARVTAERREIRAFTTELYCHPLVLERLRASSGFCPGHTRALLLRPEATFVMPTVYREVLAGILGRLEAGRLGSGDNPCLLCEHVQAVERRAAWFILRGLAAREVAEAYAAGGGFCVKHALDVLPSAPADATSLLTGVLRRRLADTNTWSECEMIAGVDEDRARRGSCRHGLVKWAGGRPQPGTVADQWAERFRADACAVCLTMGLADDRYLSWLAEEIGKRPDLVLVDCTRLCAPHLHDLYLAKRAAGAWMARRAAEIASWRLASLDPVEGTSPRSGPEVRTAPGWPSLPRTAGRHLLHAVKALWLGQRAGWRQRVRDAQTIFECSACASTRVVEWSALALIGPGLRDVTLHQAYAAGQGVCVRHLRMLRPQSRPVASRHARTRLEVLAWEVAEAARKSSWSGRHELIGDEATAWARVPGLLDGRSYLGGPARWQMRVLQDMRVGVGDAAGDMSDEAQRTVP